MESRRSISIVTPFYNEGESVAVFFEVLKRVIAELGQFDFEIVCVDDGSDDDTLAKLLIESNNDARISIVELSRNFGKEAALTAGLRFASGDAVIPIDGDLQDPPEVIPKLIEKWLEGGEVVIARRKDRRSDSFLKRQTAEKFYRVHNRISQTTIPENTGDFRLLDRSVVAALMLLPERQRFMKGLFAWIGFKVEIVEYVRAPRNAGSSKFTGIKLWNFALEGITSFSTMPLRIWTYIGMFGAFLSATYAFVIVLRVLMFGVDVPGYASLLIAMLFLGSLQLIGIGVLGEYVGRTYMESKERPIYIVRKVYGAHHDT